MKISNLFEQFNNKMVDSHSGQNDYLLTLEKDGEMVGMLEYTEFEGQPSISMIEVYDQGKGYGKALVKHLQSLFPNEEIEWGMTTEEGERLRKSLEYKIVPTKFKEYFDEFEKIKSKIAKFKEYIDRKEKEGINDTDSYLKTIEPLNDLYDREYELEELLFNEQPYKKIIT